MHLGRNRRFEILYVHLDRLPGGIASAALPLADSGDPDRRLPHATINHFRVPATLARNCVHESIRLISGTPDLLNFARLGGYWFRSRVCCMSDVVHFRIPRSSRRGGGGGGGVTNNMLSKHITCAPLAC